MRHLIVTIGSAGDLFPLIAIGLELQRRGHQVAFLAPAAIPHNPSAATGKSRSSKNPRLIRAMVSAMTPPPSVSRFGLNAAIGIFTKMDVNSGSGYSNPEL